jgi:hypothetical protein
MPGGSSWTFIGRWVALGAAAMLAGCATAPTAVFTLTVSPRVEAISYFPATSPVLAVVTTDPSSEGLQRMALAGVFDDLVALGRREALLYPQVRRLLGNEVVVGLPRVGAAPLAVLVSTDEERLRALAQARVVGGRAARAGNYRGADLYAGTGHAFAVRGPVLLVSRTTADLRRALDARHGDDNFEMSQLRRVLPSGGGKDAVARVYVDLRPAVARAGATLRAVRLIGALQLAGAVVRVDGDELAADVQVDTSGGGLVDLDVPISPGPEAPRTAAVRDAVTVTVRDLGHTLTVAERAAAAAAPLQLIRLGAVRRALGRRLLAELRGPATLALTDDGPMLRVEPSDPDAVRTALDGAAERVSRALPGVVVRSHGGLFEARRHDEILVRVRMVDGILVIGRASPDRLRAFANAPLRRTPHARGGLTFTIPGERLAAHGLPDLTLSGWLSAGTETLSGGLTTRLTGTQGV